MTLVRLRDLFTPRVELGHPAAEVLSVYREYGIVPKGSRTDNHNRTPIDLDRYQFVRPGDLVVNRMKAWQGSLGISAHEGIVSPDYEVLAPKPLAHRECDAQFLHQLLRSQPLIEEYAVRSTGIRPSQWRLYWAQMKMIQVSLGPRDEQIALRQYLGHEMARIDELIAKQDRLIAALRERRTAMIQDVIARAGGRTSKLKMHAHVQSGLTLSGDGDGADPEWPYLRVANVQTGFVDTSNIKTVRASAQDAAACLLRPGDVLMTEGGDIDKLGRGSVWDGRIHPCLHQNHVFAVRCAPDLMASYLVYVLDGASARTYFRLTAKKTTNLASTNKWTLGNLPMVIPGIRTQARTVTELDQRTARIDELIGKAERFIELARERRAALITAAVTGQIDVRGAA